MDNSNQSWETIALVRNQSTKMSAHHPVRMHESVTHDLCPLTASWVYNECNSCTIERITFKFLKRRKKVFCDECLICFSLFFNCCNDYFILNSDFVLNFLQLWGLDYSWKLPQINLMWKVLKIIMSVLSKVNPRLGDLGRTHFLL